MRFPRAGGILLHPSSLPGNYGIGELGKSAFQFLDFLHETGLSLWQILPLGPTGYGNSPYQTLSAFAGNTMLIDLDSLVAENLLSRDSLVKLPPADPKRIDYGSVIAFRNELFAQIHRRFVDGKNQSMRAPYEHFLHENQFWLNDYAIFRAIKERYGNGPWTDWPEALIHREPAALQSHYEQLRERIESVKFNQFLFFRQWHAIKARANELGINIIGDVPIFIAHDSVDVWAHQELFLLDERGHPLVVAGVPPDYFSKTGQLWGNPLYRWNVMADQRYDWWVARMRMALQLVNIVRLDHFRGFEAYWEVAAGEETAVNGRWVQGPGSHFFDSLQEQMGRLPIIAEDLGLITPEVEALRDRYEFPGMKILQFAFGSTGGTSDFLPHNFHRNCVVYSGTHDNDTCVGWFTSSDTSGTTQSAEQISRERELAKKYMNCDGHEIHWDFIRLAFASVADTAVVPLQDVLGLGSEARMNVPSRPDKNWEWRYLDSDLTPAIRERLAEISELYGRSAKR